MGKSPEATTPPIVPLYRALKRLFLSPESPKYPTNMSEERNGAFDYPVFQRVVIFFAYGSGYFSSLGGSKRLRYFQKVRWYPVRRRARRTWSERLVISSLSRFLLRPAYVAAILGCCGWSSLIILLMVVQAASMVVGGRCSSSRAIVASLAFLSAISFPGILQWPGTHWIITSAMRLLRLSMVVVIAEVGDCSVLQSDCDRSRTWLLLII